MILLFLQYGPLAQLVARLVRIEEVRSSNLLGSTTIFIRSYTWMNPFFCAVRTASLPELTPSFR